MPSPTITDAFDMLCIRAGEDGRDDRLFGGCIQRARELLRPFIIGSRFPSVFLECPLAGDPFLDVTVLYGSLSDKDVVKSKYAGDCEKLFRRYSNMKQTHHDVSFGFELDTSKEDPGMAAIHFEPRTDTGLVLPFCEAIGEEKNGELYLQTAAKLADTTPLSYFGMFRGRDDAPLRVCGYLEKEKMVRMINDKDSILSLFGKVGFTAYDDRMIDEIINVLKMAPRETDYQFDIYEDGKAGDVFSIDLRLVEKSAASVRESFRNGTAAKIMSHFSELGIADERTDMLSGMSASFAFPAVNENGEITGYKMIIHPMWLKIRWKGARLCNAKCYSLMRAGFIK